MSRYDDCSSSIQNCQLNEGTSLMQTLRLMLSALCFTTMWSSFCFAKTPEYALELKDHLFVPEQLVIPANTKFKLIITNHDDILEEFDSFSLNREKVIFPKQQAIIYVGPLPAGKYKFFGEYHPDSARGKIIIRAQEANHAD